MRKSPISRAFTIIELLTVIFAIALLLCAVVPAIAGARGESRMTVSLQNLKRLAQAHADYAAEWNGRQVCYAVDDLSDYGNDPTTAIINYQFVHGEPHPHVELGVCHSTLWMYGLPSDGLQYGSWPILPIDFFSGSWGAFRSPNSKALNTYVDGRYFSPTFYAPTDTALYPLVEPLLEHPCEWMPSSVTGGFRFSSYCLSPAAMFNPGVLRAPSKGGYQNPWTMSGSFTTPSFSQVLYPHLKTHMLEHHWNQNAPDDVCNPHRASGTLAGCEPYYFNQGFNSEPATLFYDGSTRLLPNAEVIAADAQILKQTNGVDGLWHRGTPMGATGYFGSYSYDNCIVSHHILTTDGVLGRDTLGLPRTSPSRDDNTD